MEAKQVILLANGTSKADIIQKALEGEISNQVPASILQKHPNCSVVLDKEAAAKLTR
jgi:glucosamine-6-phosphate deaminase